MPGVLSGPKSEQRVLKGKVARDSDKLPLFFIYYTMVEYVQACLSCEKIVLSNQAVDGLFAEVRRVYIKSPKLSTDKRQHWELSTGLSTLSTGGGRSQMGKSYK